jgi:hypothetical protein
MNTPTDLRSPYQPPMADLSPPRPELPIEPHERSGAPKVFGVLSIIFASLMLFFSALGLLATAATASLQNLGSVSRTQGDNAEKAENADKAEKAEQLDAMMRPMAKVYRGIGFQSAIFFVMSAVLLAIGIGQLRFRAWAGRWSVYWGAAGLVCVGLLVAISLLIISPAYGELLQSLAQLKPQADGQPALAPPTGGLTAVFGGTFAFLSVIVYAPYPALMLLFFTRDRVRASMTG